MGQEACLFIHKFMKNVPNGKILESQLWDV